MGSYAEFKVAGYSILTTQSHVEPVFMTVFREGDKRIAAEVIEEDGEVARHKQIKYATTIAIAKQRLGIMGFSLRKTITDFNTRKRLLVESLQEEIREIEKSEIEHADPDGDKSDLYADEQRNLDLLRKATIDDFIDSFRQLRTRSLITYLAAFGKDSGDLAPLGRYMLKAENGEGSYLLGFPCSDDRFFLRAFLESADDNDEVCQDISEVVSAGYYDEEDSVVTDSLAILTGQYPANEKVILLTEGSTDARLLGRTMRLLFPEFSEYYTFMDFADSNAQGGAASLVNTVRSFSAAGISNRVIALFDNDTAAHDAVRALQKTKLLPNVHYMFYPEIDVARRYPTLGPSGIVEIMDVNGLACSLELFFGEDVLSSGAGMTPIQWTGYTSSLQKYQGVVLHKIQMIKRYDDKLTASEANPELVQEEDFPEMRILLQAIFAEFQ